MTAAGDVPEDAISLRGGCPGNHFLKKLRSLVFREGVKQAVELGFSIRRRLRTEGGQCSLSGQVYPRLPSRIDEELRYKSRASSPSKASHMPARKPRRQASVSPSSAPACSNSSWGVRSSRHAGQPGQYIADPGGGVAAGVAATDFAPSQRRLGDCSQPALRHLR